MEKPMTHQNGRKGTKKILNSILAQSVHVYCIYLVYFMLVDLFLFINLCTFSFDFIQKSIPMGLFKSNKHKL